MTAHGKIGWPKFGLTVLAVMLIFAFSLWTSLLEPNGAVFVCWVVVWTLGSSADAVRWRHWSWPLLCTGSMLPPWLLWTALYGRTAGQSSFVFTFAVVYLIAAVFGATIGFAIGAPLQRCAARAAEGSDNPAVVL